MKIIPTTGNEEIAKVYIMELAGDRLVECVESLQPQLPIENKMVSLHILTLMTNRAITL